MAIKHYDQYLRVMKGADAYHNDKVKAGAIGGSLGKPNIQKCKINGKAVRYFNFKTQRTLPFLCLQDIERCKRGKTYELTVGGPVPPFGLSSWVEFLSYFSERKVLK